MAIQKNNLKIWIKKKSLKVSKEKSFYNKVLKTSQQAKKVEEQ